jgi:hypothetical protein
MPPLNDKQVCLTITACSLLLHTCTCVLHTGRGCRLAVTINLHRTWQQPPALLCERLALLEAPSLLLCGVPAPHPVPPAAPQRPAARSQECSSRCNTIHLLGCCDACSTGLTAR